MASHEDHARRIFDTRTSAAQTLVRLLKATAAWLSAWIQFCADRYAAAALYDTLSRLSDADLHRRGLSRDSLAHDLIGTHENATAAGSVVPFSPASAKPSQRQEGDAVR